MKLREAEALAVFNDHQRRVGQVDTDLDDRGGDQQLDRAIFKPLHHRLLFRGFQAAMYQADFQATETAAKVRCNGLRSLRLDQV